MRIVLTLAVLVAGCSLEVSAIAAPPDAQDDGGVKGDGGRARADAGPDRTDGGRVADSSVNVDGGDVIVDAGDDTTDGGPACSPSTETCNAEDDDCDARVDEDSCADCTRTASAGAVYLVCPATLSWDVARSDCLRRGYDLTIIGSSAENDLVRTLGAGHDDIWIGLEDRATDMTFVWVDGTVAYRGGTSVLFTFFRPGEPLGGLDNDCVELDTGDNGYWNDVGCIGLKGYVCEASP